MLNFDFCTTMRLRENRIILRREPVLNYCRPARIRENLKIDRMSAYKGYLSNNARNTIEKRLQCWFNAIFIINKDNRSAGAVRQFAPVMITVTLASKQVHDDKFIKRHILQEFLKSLCRHKNIKYTFWKAEAQRNGNIHFHILIDRYIDMKFVQGMWNYYQGKHGYLNERIKSGLDRNAPSTKITGMNSSKSPISYVLKYVKKQVSRRATCNRTAEGCKAVCALLQNVRRPIQGCIFRFSEPLICLTPAIMIISPAFNDHLEEKVREGKLRYVHCDFCEMLYCVRCHSYDVLTEFYQNEVNNFHRDVYKYLYVDQGIIKKVKEAEIDIKKEVEISQLKINFQLN